MVQSVKRNWSDRQTDSNAANQNEIQQKAYRS